MHPLLPHRLLMNITILVPNGTTQHGNERILCLPITSNYWPSILTVFTFFATNFLAHAATVKSSPGDNRRVKACNAFLALLFPMSGLLRALNAILGYSRGATELEKARNAGALCMVVRDRHWRPKDLADLHVGVVRRLPDGEEDIANPTDAELITYLPADAREKSSGWVHFDSVWAQSYVDLRSKQIHGTKELPPGYTFAIVPRDTIFDHAGVSDREISDSHISASKDALKTAASVVQVVSAGIALISHRPDLLSRWGYASYHLTVIPYLIMTLVNLFSNLLVADYPCLYMVWTDTMGEAEQAGGKFEGVVGRTIPLHDTGVDLVEELPYSGVTDEAIVKVAAGSSISWETRVVLGLSLLVPVAVRKRRQARRNSTTDPTTTTLRISGISRNSHVVRPSAASDTTSTVSNEQISSSSERDLDSAVLSRGENEIEMHGVDERDFENEPKFCFVEAESDLGQYRVRISRTPVHSPVYGFRDTVRSAMDDKSRRWRRCASYESELLLLIAEPGPSEVSLRADDPSAVNDSEPAILITFYYPSCSRFLRTSNSQRQTMLPSRESSDGSTHTGTNGHHARNTGNNPITHTRWGVLLDAVIGLALVALSFGIVAYKTGFKPGQSSTTERGVMMAWLASGLYGFYLPFLSTSELFRIWVLLPIVSTICYAFDLWNMTRIAWQTHKLLWRILILQLKNRGLRQKPLRLQLKHIISIMQRRNLQLQEVGLPFPLINPHSLLIIFFIFVPPIWGLVLVGRMLVEWGSCTRLY